MLLETVVRMIEGMCWDCVVASFLLMVVGVAVALQRCVLDAVLVETLVFLRSFRLSRLLLLP